MTEILSNLPPVTLSLAFMLMAALYAAVGHGGASAYLALLGLTGMVPGEMKPVALTLNIVVSWLALLAFARGGHFRSSLFWPLAGVSVPAAFVGGLLPCPDPVFKLLLAVALLFGAWRLVVAPARDASALRVPRPAGVLLLGLVIGFLSGLIGIGGGIFLTPVLVLCHWAPAKSAAAVSAAFIVVNSLAGLAGLLVGGGAIPSLTWSLMPAVLAGGWLGSLWGSGQARSAALQRVLAAVLVVAATKFMIP